MLNEKIILAKLKGERKSYWVMLDTAGSMVDMPDKLHEVLHEKEWTSLHVKQLREGEPEIEGV